MKITSKSQQTQDNPYAALAGNYAVPAAQADITDRLSFIRNTYMHLAGAIFAFVAIETLIFAIFGDQILNTVVPTMLGSGFSWLIVLGAFMGASWVATYWANHQTSRTMQYMGLGLYVLAQVVIFLPILAIAQHFFPGSIATAAVITGVVFGGLTLTVFVTRVDFSFLRMALIAGSLAAFTAIIVGTIFGLPIFGSIFCGLMVLLAAGTILYQTSAVLHHYSTDQYVGAALALFAAVALLFWYILQLVMMFYNE